MSRLPTEPSPWPLPMPVLPANPMPVRAWPQAAERILERTLRRARGRIAQQVLYVSPAGVSAWNASERENVGQVGHGANSDARANEFADFDAWCRANEGCDARLLVSSHLLHSLVIDPGLQLSGEPEVRGYAAQQFSHYHGAQARQWPMAVWAQPSHSGACALHSVDLPALLGLAAAHDVQLRSIAPVWSAGLDSLSTLEPAFAGAQRQALALVEGRLVTWLVAEAACLVAVQQRFIDTPRVEPLADLLNRLVVETGPLCEPPLLVGWGVEDTGLGSSLPARVMTDLGARTAAAEWVLDAMGKRA